MNRNHNRAIVPIPKSELAKNRKSLLVLASSISLGLITAFSTIVIFPVSGFIGLLLFFFPVVAVSAWFGGLLTGALTSCLAALGSGYFLFTVVHPRDIHLFDVQVQLFILLLEGVFISFVIEKSKQSEELTEYKRLQREYTDIILQLQKKYKKAEDEIKARDEFLSIASHELKTPLTSMLMQIQSVLYNIRHVSLADFSVENLLRMLDSAEHQSKRVSKMINDLLNVSLITTGRLDLELEETDLVSIVKHVIDNLSEKAKRDGCTIHLKTDPSVKGTWDKLRIEQVVTNLITNAVKYGDKKPIEVNVSQADSVAKIAVVDHGIGIPPEEQEKIFARFQRAATAKNYEGLGVGLYITSQIIKAHNGSINVKSKEGKGTTFEVQLPVKLPELKVEK